MITLLFFLLISFSISFFIYLNYKKVKKREVIILYIITYRDMATGIRVRYPFSFRSKDRAEHECELLKKRAKEVKQPRTYFKVKEIQVDSLLNIPIR